MIKMVNVAVLAWTESRDSGSHFARGHEGLVTSNIRKCLQTSLRTIGKLSEASVALDANLNNRCVSVQGLGRPKYAKSTS